MLLYLLCHAQHVISYSILLKFETFISIGDQDGFNHLLSKSREGRLAFLTAGAFIMILGRFFVFGVIAFFGLYGLLWGLKDTRRIIEFPFVYSSGLVLFSLFQMIPLCFDAKSVPDQAFYLGSFMILACSMAGFFGYFSCNKKFRYSPSVIRHLNYDKLFWLGIGFCILGHFGHYQLMGVLRGRSRPGLWTGWAVYWNALRQLNSLGIIFLVVSGIYTKKYKRLIFAIFFSLIFINRALMGGHRSTAIFVLCIFVLPAMLRHKKLRIHRGVVITVLFLSFVIVYAFGVWRGSGPMVSPGRSLQPLGAILERRMDPEAGRGSETAYAFLIIGSVWESNSYRFLVVEVYNDIVETWVPGLLVGRDFKDRLKISTAYEPLSVISNNVYGRSLSRYSAFPAYSEFFVYFGFLGSILVAWLARVYKRAVFLAVEYQQAWAIMLVCLFFLLPARILYGGVFSFLVSNLVNISILIAVVYLASERCVVGIFDSYEVGPKKDRNSVPVMPFT